MRRLRCYSGKYLRPWPRFRARLHNATILYVWVSRWPRERRPIPRRFGRSHRLWDMDADVYVLRPFNWITGPAFWLWTHRWRLTVGPLVRLGLMVMGEGGYYREARFTWPGKGGCRIDWPPAWGGKPVNIWNEREWASLIPSQRTEPEG